ncbi:MAG: hypothetical protein ABIY55_31645 [Kofleriaceae bacterium]
MSQLTIDLASTPYDVMLVIEHPSGVTYCSSSVCTGPVEGRRPALAS